VNNGRAFRRYDERAPDVPTFAAPNTDEPIAGFYRMRLRSGGVYVGVRLWHGLPLDPSTLDEMDRAPRWNALINGRWANVTDAWPRCAGEPIEETDYRHLSRQQAWALDHAPESAFANPKRKLNPLTSPLLF
jgi:hypothetical protein